MTNGNKLSEAKASESNRTISGGKRTRGWMIPCLLDLGPVWQPSTAPNIIRAQNRPTRVQIFDFPLSSNRCHDTEDNQ